MATRLTYLGAAGFDIEGPEHRILIDPFLSENPAAPMSHDELEAPDVILVSHAAFDHYGDTASIAKATAPARMIARFSSVVATGRWMKGYERLMRSR